jgi:hypothetical protein
MTFRVIMIRIIGDLLASKQRGGDSAIEFPRANWGGKGA